MVSNAMGELWMAAATAANGVHSMQAASATHAPTSGSITANVPASRSMAMCGRTDNLRHSEAT